nr:hypothetical protein [Candidatus Sigynarchaeota archaeon]
MTEKDKLDIEQFNIQDFIDPKSGLSGRLEDAVNFCETHEGCPFFANECDQAVVMDCCGVWIKMGTPCSVFAEKIKLCIRSMTGIQK